MWLPWIERASQRLSLNPTGLVNHDKAPTIYKAPTVYVFSLTAPEQTSYLLDEKTDLPEITGLNLRAVWEKLLGTPEGYSLRKRERDLWTKMRKIMESSSSVDGKLI